MGAWNQSKNIKANSLSTGMGVGSGELIALIQGRIKTGGYFFKNKTDAAV